VVSFTPRPLYPYRNNPSYSLNTRLGRLRCGLNPQDRRKNSVSPVGNQTTGAPSISTHPSHRTDRAVQATVINRTFWDELTTPNFLNTFQSKKPQTQLTTVRRSQVKQTVIYFAIFCTQSRDKHYDVATRTFILRSVETSLGLSRRIFLL
jgi:hypothetical protein